MLLQYIKNGRKMNCVDNNFLINDVSVIQLKYDIILRMGSNSLKKKIGATGVCQHPTGKTTKQGTLVAVTERPGRLDGL